MTAPTLSDNMAPIRDQNDEEISLFDLLQVVADNLRLLILAPLVAGLLALGYSFTITPTFTASTKILSPQQQASGAAAMLQSLGGFAGLKSPDDQYIAFMRSRSVQDALVDRFNILERNKTQSREAARAAVAGSTRVLAGKDGLISLSFDRTIMCPVQRGNFKAQIELTALRSQVTLTEKEQPTSSVSSKSGGKANESDYLTKYRDYKYFEALFELFTKQYEIARIDESREGTAIQVLDVAESPDRKSGPNKARMAALASLSAGFALLLFVFVRHAIRGAAQDPILIEKLFKLRHALTKAIGRV